MHKIHLLFIISGVLGSALFAPENINIKGSNETEAVTSKKNTSLKEDNIVENDKMEKSKNSEGLAKQSATETFLNFFRPSTSSTKTKKEEVTTKTKKKVPKSTSSSTRKKKTQKVTTLTTHATKTVTITSYKYVTVYKTASANTAEGTSSHEGLFSTKNLKTLSPQKSVTVTGDIDRNINNLTIEHETLKHNKKILEDLKKEKRKAREKIESLEKELNKIEKSIAISTQKEKSSKEMLKDKISTYKNDKSIFEKKKKQAEKEINTKKKVLTKTAQEIEKGKEKKKILETQIKNKADEQKEIKKTVDAVKGVINSSTKKEEVVVMKSAEKVKAKEKDQSKIQEEQDKQNIKNKEESKTQKKPYSDKPKKKLAQKALPSLSLAATDERSNTKNENKKDPSAISSNAETMIDDAKKRVMGIKEEEKKEIEKITGKEKKCQSNKKDTSSNKIDTQKTIKPQQEVNPLKETDKQTFSSTGKSFAPSFTQNFSNGHLIVSGTPISAGPDVIEKTQKQFKHTLVEAAKKAKPDEKILAFWGHITSLLSGNQ